MGYWGRLDENEPIGLNTEIDEEYEPIGLNTEIDEEYFDDE